LRRFVSNSANAPSICKKHRPAALELSIGCSVAFGAAPLLSGPPRSVVKT
jgi:hypothetical protein